MRVYTVVVVEVECMIEYVVIRTSDNLQENSVRPSLFYHHCEQQDIRYQILL